MPFEVSAELGRAGVADVVGGGGDVAASGDEGGGSVQAERLDELERGVAGGASEPAIEDGSAHAGLVGEVVDGERLIEVVANEADGVVEVVGLSDGVPERGAGWPGEDEVEQLAESAGPEGSAAGVAREVSRSRYTPGSSGGRLISTLSARAACSTGRVVT